MKSSLAKIVFLCSLIISLCGHTAYASPSLVIDHFSDGIVAPWDISDDITPAGGTFYIVEEQGILKLSAGGSASWNSAGVSKTLTPSNEIAISFNLAASFPGSSGNKRFGFHLKDTAGNLLSYYTGKDKANEWHSQVCGTFISCTSPAAYSAGVNNARTTITVFKVGTNVTIKRNAQVIYNTTTSLTDIEEISFVMLANNAETFTAVLNDFVMLSGN